MAWHTSSLRGWQPGHLDPERLAACLSAVADSPELRDVAMEASPFSSRLSRDVKGGEFASATTIAANAAAAAADVASMSKAVTTRSDEAVASPFSYARKLARWAIPILLCLYIAADKADVFRSPTFRELWCCGPFASSEVNDAATTWLEPLLYRRDAPPPLLVDFGTLDLGLFSRRQLEATSSTSSAGSSASTSTQASSSASHGSAAGEHDAHPHEAMFFLVTSLITGTAVTHVLSFPLFHGIQQTVVLYVLGVVMSLIIHGGKFVDDMGVFGRSYTMWMGIDGHLLLFTMLPPLVTGDAMAIDTSVAKRVMKQCLYLAGPGVCIAGFATALFLWVYLGAFYDWDFLLCLTAGAILCATDPVAVVALLKELGASPTLTVQIQGESLLNDGTAIVLYTIAYNMLSGVDYDVGDIINILVKMAIYAWILGSVIGFCFYKWIKLANNKLDHSSSVIQVSLTIACAYSSFTLAEGWLKISGVLSTVAAAGVLAHKMWPSVTRKETMNTVWHMLEYLFNSIIFFLAGCLTGQIMGEVDAVDYVHLLVIYFVITFIRGTLFYCSLPLLTQLHQDKAKVTAADVAVMTWGGLRGAIGLALGIQVKVGCAGGKISQENANRVLFYVSGVAFLTLTINATTCPALVNWLGITQMPETKQKMLLNINAQLIHLACEHTKPGKVRQTIMHVLAEVEEHIVHHRSKLDHMKDALHNASHAPAAMRRMTVTSAKIEIKATKQVCKSQALSHFTSAIKQESSDGQLKPAASESSEKGQGKNWVLKAHGDTAGQSVESIVSQFKIEKAKYARMMAANAKLGDKSRAASKTSLPPIPFAAEEEDFISILENAETDAKLIRAVVEAFLSIVRASYWAMIEHDSFYADEAEKMLSSITLALSSNFSDLGDFEIIEHFVATGYEESGGRVSTVSNPSPVKSAGADGFGMKGAATMSKVELGPQSALQIFVESNPFSMIIAFAIASNSVITTIEQETRDKDEQSLAWLSIEILYTVVFLVEFVFKLAAYKFKYFQSGWNLFDFILVTLGVVGSSFSIMVATLPNRDSDSGVPSSEARLIRIAQIFRMVRIVRLFRLYKFWLAFRTLFTKNFISLDVAEYMQKVSMLSGFVQAHMHAQRKLVQFFGKEGLVDTGEVARTLLQSKISMYRAIILMEKGKRKINKNLLCEVEHNVELRATADDCAHFIHKASQDGVLTAHEAHSMLHPVFHCLGSFTKKIKDVHQGHIDEEYAHRGRTWAERDSVASENEDGFDISGSATPAQEDKEVENPDMAVKDKNSSGAERLRTSSRPSPTLVGREDPSMGHLKKHPSSGDEPAQEPSPEAEPPQRLEAASAGLLPAPNGAAARARASTAPGGPEAANATTPKKNFKKKVGKFKQKEKTESPSAQSLLQAEGKAENIPDEDAPMTSKLTSGTSAAKPIVRNSMKAAGSMKGPPSLTLPKAGPDVPKKPTRNWKDKKSPRPAGDGEMAEPKSAASRSSAQGSAALRSSAQGSAAPRTSTPVDVPKAPPPPPEDDVESKPKKKWGKKKDPAAAGEVDC